VAAWAAWVGRMLGSEADGFKIMVGANEANRTLIGLALNRPIREGDWVHLGVAPQRDGLTACVRRSVVAVDHPSRVTEDQRFWMDLVEEGYRVGEEAYRKVAAENLPARLQEQALVDYFARRSAEVSARVGKPVDLASLKPYTGTHNSGYTECQEFFGAITLDSHEPLGNRIVTMLDVALRGGMIPVVASVGAAADGQVFNINADSVAGDLAAAVGAEKIVFLTDVGGILEDDGFRGRDFTDGPGAEVYGRLTAMGTVLRTDQLARWLSQPETWPAAAPNQAP